MLRLTLLRREEGQDLIEYAVLIAPIAITAIVSVAFLGEEISQVLSDVASTLQSALCGARGEQANRIRVTPDT
jgi:Flp pilus assembly pilin Flp